MRRLLVYALAILVATFVGIVAWGLSEARLGLAALDLAIVLGLLWFARRFPKPRFTGGSMSRAFYMIAGSAVLFTVGVLLLAPVYVQYHDPCGPARVGICEFNTRVVEMKRIWMAFAGVLVASLTLLAGLMASAHHVPGHRAGGEHHAPVFER